MDESVLTGNISRVRREHLLRGAADAQSRDRASRRRSQPRDRRNPLAPGAFVVAFAEALKTVKAEKRVKSTILKELNQAPLADITAMYSDLNKRLQSLHVIPAGAQSIVNRGGAADRARGPGRKATCVPRCRRCRSCSHSRSTSTAGRDGRDGAVPADVCGRGFGSAARATVSRDAARISADGGAPMPQIPGMPPGFPQMGGAPMPAMGGGSRGAVAISRR